jgi:hypothetical protein
MTRSKTAITIAMFLKIAMALSFVALPNANAQLKERAHVKSPVRLTMHILFNG